MNLSHPDLLHELPDIEFPSSGALIPLPQKNDLCGTKEAARILQTPLPTVYFLAQNQRLPAFRVGGRWRFHRSKLWQIVNASIKSRPQTETPLRLKNRQTALSDRISSAVAKAIAAADGQMPQKIVVCLVFDGTQTEVEVPYLLKAVG